MKLTTIVNEYVVLVDGVEVSRHATDSEASAAAGSLETTTPAAVVEFYHDYRVLVEADVVVEPPPVDPPPVDPPPANGLLDMLAALPAGTLYEFPDSHFMQINPCPGDNCVWSAVEGFAAMMESWSGGCYDSKRNRLVIWGGGHTAYYGNEVAAFDVDTGKWLLLSAPSTNLGITDHTKGTYGMAYYADGLPASRHTYDKLEYHPGLDSMFSSADYKRATDSFNFATNTFDSNWKLFGEDGVYFDHHSSSAYNSNDGCLYYKADLSNPLYKFDPMALPDDPKKGKWTRVTGSFYMNPDATMEIDTDTNTLVLVGSGCAPQNCTVIAIPLNSPKLVKPVITGDGRGIDLLRKAGIGCVYDSTEKRFVLWLQGNDFFELRYGATPTDPWVVKKLKLQPTSIQIQPTGRQVYGQFRMIPGMNAVVGVKGAGTNAFALKLTTECEEIQPPVLVNGQAQTLQSAVNGTAAGGTVTIGAGALTAGAAVSKALSFVGAGIDASIIKGGVVNNKGLINNSAAITVSGVTFDSAQGSQKNEAGIRQDAGAITVTDSKFVNCWNGYLGIADATFERCVFDGNGYGDGYSHGIYSSTGATTLTVKSSTFSNTRVGHHIKSRAKNTLLTDVTCNAGTESYSIDAPNGGTVVLDGVVASQGPNSENAVLINYGSEGSGTGFTHSVTVKGTSRRSVLSSSGVANPIAIRVSSLTPANVTVENTDFLGFAADKLVTGALSVTYTNCTLDGLPI